MMPAQSLRFATLGTAITLALSLGACQTLAGDAPASVDLGDPGTRATVTGVLARAVGRARIELGPTDGPNTSVISVLPPRPGPYEMNATALPIRFDIVRRDGRCVAIRHDTAEAYDLPDDTCKP